MEPQAARRPRHGPPWAARAAVLAAGALLVAAAGMLGPLTHSAPQLPRLPAWDWILGDSAAPDPAPAPSESTDPALVSGLGEGIATALFVLLLLLVAGLVMASRGSAQGGTAGTAEPDEPDEARDRAVRERVLGGLRAASAALAPGPRTSTDAVVAAWLAVEDASAAHGSARGPAQTPSEYAASLLRSLDVPPAPLARLLALYQRARYAGSAPEGSISPAELAQARRDVAELTDHVGRQR
ncbi:DUF4129 domain-containing protein [Zafaria sp. Z1313]|uniref:DUF4129 domain-containing protein n=1 Tax=unclassified Zafaria TaxID=2828765 RepID=UPI002E76A6D1|nr:DUF4129 domain-containing protein [Zafaria sp. J156]MEE1620862.1 DUF4129 domain-containing protein [Zafaria sp. J156]